MTIQSSGPIAFSNVSTEIGQAPTYTTSLSFLNNEVKPSVRPAIPNMSIFYGMSYFQNTTEGNCNNGNEANCACNCGNSGQYTNCENCTAINCANCDDKAYLQVGANCACSYNCDSSQIQTNCNCACNCSKIICSKLYDIGAMAPAIFAADQAYGKWLFKNDKVVYRGYIRWARIVTAWMDGKGPDFMFWIRDKEKRVEAQKELTRKMATKMGIPWAEHMAFKMGALREDNLHGKVLMSIGVPICRFLDKMPRVRERDRRHRLPVLLAMWAAFYGSQWTASAVTAVDGFIRKITSKVAAHANINTNGKR